ncbi:hypothetical protein [Actinobaculum sp. 352]|uniref:hypothetical protein n=1 Tax=Actinobaculum sp. 352 TaxID=2490946 RepID=UPI000F7E44DE|nr:hypothetical protein [Actinobaculum sp. 352]RTE49598.1 hypothetical protein EKN07_06020 [Actinobaculum sp. 352]
MPEQLRMALPMWRGSQMTDLREVVAAIRPDSLRWVMAGAWVIIERNAPDAVRRLLNAAERACVPATWQEVRECARWSTQCIELTLRGYEQQSALQNGDDAGLRLPDNSETDNAVTPRPDYSEADVQPRSHAEVGAPLPNEAKTTTQPPCEQGAVSPGAGMSDTSYRPGPTVEIVAVDSTWWEVATSDPTRLDMEALRDLGAEYEWDDDSERTANIQHGTTEGESCG